MSQITCCPSCGTRFKVVADQLRISDGWVRCGHCKAIFDASAHLQALSTAHSEVEEFALPGHPETAPPPPKEAPKEAPKETPKEVEPTPAPACVVEPPPTLPEAAPIEEAITEIAPASAAPDTAHNDPIEASNLKDSKESKETKDSKESKNSKGSKDSKKPEPTSPSKNVEPSFVRAARRQAFWQGTGVRIVLALCAVIFSATLAAQIAIHERNYIATWKPQLRPLLNQICDQWGCIIQHYQDITAIVIDSSGFQKANKNLDNQDNQNNPDGEDNQNTPSNTPSNTPNGLYQLKIALKNHASISVATPAIELTLTDAQEKIILRRILLPTELGAPTELAAHDEWAGAISVSLSGDALQVVGYRMLSFYPE